MTTFCPKCDTELDNFLYNLEIRGEDAFFKFEKFECPHCGAKCQVKLEASFYVEEDKDASNNSNNMQSPETPCLEAHIPIVAQKPLGVAAAALGGVRDNSASKNQNPIKGGKE